MKTLKKVNIIPAFVDEIPRNLIKEVLYISKKYEIAIHQCLCGCGNESVTSLKSGEWTLSEKDGKISMTPSILNRFCGTHYIITDNIANIV